MMEIIVTIDQHLMQSLTDVKGLSNRPIRGILGLRALRYHGMCKFSTEKTRSWRELSCYTQLAVSFRVELCYSRVLYVKRAHARI